VVASYRQTVHAYPSGGGDYEVVSTNLGPHAGLLVASALLSDYVLTVAVSVSSGTSYLAAAVPWAEGHKVEIAVGIATVLALLNLRGSRESGGAFAIPTYLYMAAIGVLAVVGLVQEVTGTLGRAESSAYEVVAQSGWEQGLTGLAALAAPAETWQFFTWAMWDPGRAGFADYSGNQNLKGAIARALPESSWNPVWAACSLLTVLAAWFLCRRLDRLRGTGDTADDAGEAGLVLALQVSVVMVLGLLISPISWSHHWVWCLPALMSVGAATWRWRSIALGVAGVAGVLVFFLAMQWWFPEQNHVEQNWPAWAKAVGSSYTWWALACGTVLWWVSGRRQQSQLDQECDRTHHLRKCDHHPCQDRHVP